VKNTTTLTLSTALLSLCSLLVTGCESTKLAETSLAPVESRATGPAVGGGAGGAGTAGASATPQSSVATVDLARSGAGTAGAAGTALTALQSQRVV